MKTWTTIFLLLILPAISLTQKTIYIPLEWQAGSLDYSLEHSAESDNFIIFWGPLAGTDPTQAPTDIAFNPQEILNTAEDLYRFYIDTIKFVDDDHGGLITQYKIILVMLHTWTGLEGWAFGGNYDSTVGAMWMHPHAASSGPTLAHEFTHTLQNYTWMMNPGHGFIDSSYVGFFWETHAEFMALQRYPSVAREFDMARWLNTNHFHWSSTRHHYQAFIFLQFLKEKHGIGIINRMWNEANIGEHPLQTYIRLTEIDQEALNNLFVEYAMRNVTWDYEIQEDLRIRMQTLPRQFVKNETIIPDLAHAALQWYEVPNYLAPQDYGYNVIRLYPEAPQPDCDKQVVYAQIAEHLVYPDIAALSIDFGFVAVDQSGHARYSEIVKYGEGIFEYLPTDTALFLVVVGVPSMHHNYPYEIGFPKIHRQPYSFRIRNAKPEGYQPGFNKPPAGVSGASHANGGGFVASSATVDATAYIGPNALVLDNAHIIGDVIIDGYAVIKDNATVLDGARIDRWAVIGEDAQVSGDAYVTDRAHVFGGSTVYDSAVVGGSALLFFTQAHEQAVLGDNVFTWGADLHGDVRLGGDAEFFSECADGTYMQVDFAYNRFCDGLDEHPANVDLQQRVVTGAYASLYSLVCDTLLDNFYETIRVIICEGDTFYYNGIPFTSEGDTLFYQQLSDGSEHFLGLEIAFYQPLAGVLINEACANDTIWIEGYPIIPGVTYDSLFVSQNGDCFGIYISGSIGIIPVDTSVLVTDNKIEIVAPALFVQWYDCETNMPVPGAVGKTFTPIESGYYKAFIYSLDSCEAFSGCHFVLGTATHDPATVSWNLYPNPASRQLTVTVSDIQGSGYRMIMTDGLGHFVRLADNRIFTERTIDISHMPAGMYSLRLIADDGAVSTRRFSKID